MGLGVSDVRFEVTSADGRAEVTSAPSLRPHSPQVLPEAGVIRLASDVMTSFMRLEAEEMSALEIRRCAQAAERTRKTLVIGYVSALRCWGVDVASCRLATDVIHVAAPRQSARTHARGVAAHVWRAAYDVRTMPNAKFLVASPAMAWAQIAQHVSDEVLAITGSTMLCRDPRRRTANKAQLLKYVMDNPLFKGRSRCLLAIPYLVENTDSPPEALLYMLLLKRGIDGLCVNYLVRQRNGRDCFIDIAIPEVKVGIEYQGRYHSDPGQMRSDASRMNALISDGWIMLQATAADLQSEQARNAFVESIVALVRHRMHLMAYINHAAEVTSA